MAVIAMIFASLSLGDLLILAFFLRGQQGRAVPKVFLFPGGSFPSFFKPENNGRSFIQDLAKSVAYQNLLGVNVLTITVQARWKSRGRM